VDIYKRGPLHTWKVLLTAESFGDLLRRYKYLYLTSEQDRALVSDVERLRDRVAKQRGEIVLVKDQLDATRIEREQELNQYNRLADAREKRLGTLQRSARANAQRLLQLERDASRLNNVLAALEKAARDEAARNRASGGRAAPIAGALTTASLGRLDWPVEGRIVYQFGRDTLPQGGVIRWNGIGIAATPGTPVHAVEAGRVRLVETMGTYGLTVILEHGNGYYSIYSHLQGAAVKAGDDVKKGQILGAVGGENSDYGPHLHFEIRGENQMALDPLDWLRRR
jgi:septal ring factor EnvC (AmiA/AmiB activator)